MRRLINIVLLLMAVCGPTIAMAQRPVAAVERWVATVDSLSQQIVLRWSASADSSAWGYHICTGTPCTDYDTVFGRTDTSYWCVDHDPTERHTYRLHVFDSSHNVSALTPAFGNIVLEATVPVCSTAVEARWSPYEGMPGGVRRYSLMVRQEPFDTDYVAYYTTDSAGQLAYGFDMSPGATRVGLRVVAYGDALRSVSNEVTVVRLTADTASRLGIERVNYDSIGTCVRLTVQTDSAFVAAPYRLWRSIDGSPWREIGVVEAGATTFVDRDINPYDSLHCYQLSVADACDMNDRYSDTRCVVVPDPPLPAVAIANSIVVGSERNGRLLPQTRGLKGDLYEFAVYDRGGRRVFATNDPTEAWQPDQHTQQGAYAYVLRLRFNNNRIHTYTGTVLVLE